MRERKRTLAEIQAAFTRRLAELILRASIEDIQVKLTWVLRSEQEQRRLFEEGRTKTLKSKHLVGLAADLYVVRNGETVLTDSPEYTRLGEIWEMMGGRWGGRFTSFRDIFHFEENL